MGLSDLSDVDRLKVKKANFQLRSSVRIIRKCIEFGVPGYLENPRTSRVWLTPHIKRLISSKKAVFVDFDQCQYNTPHRKPTRLLVWGVEAGELNFDRCKGSGGLCSKTGKHHIILEGASKGGDGKWAFRTSASQQYTAALGERLATMLINSNKSANRAELG